MSDYLKAIGQFITDPRLWKLVILCFLMSCIAFGALWYGLGWLLEMLSLKLNWFHNVLKWGAWIGSFVAALFLFPALFGVIGGFFYEAVADAVDARHFPHLPTADGAPLRDSLISGVKYFLLLLGLNLVALPAYIALLFLLGSGFIVYVLVNGTLFGREHFDAVALRRMPAAQARTWRLQNRGALFSQGVITACLSLVPLVNFIVPLLGVASMVHVVNRGATPPALPPVLPTA